MSINVTVTGNPISIKRGKMVTSDSYQAKKEKENRRLMRLKQVRQQSKNIAEDVRNKVRKEKEKQLQKIEEEGKQKLKDWQSKKLVELKNQFEEALQELGKGHKQATEVIDEDEILAEQKKVNDKVACHRGQVAATKLQIEKNKDSLKKAIPIQHKKLVRDIENTRAVLISNIKEHKHSNLKCNDKMKKRKKPVADINITVPSSDVDNSDLVINLENSSEDKLSNIDGEEGPWTSSCECVGTSENPSQPSPFMEDSTSSLELVSSQISPKEQGQPLARGVTSLAKEIQDRRRLIEQYRQKPRGISPPLDTRISDRIKRRELMASKPDYCDIVAKTHAIPIVESNTQLRKAVDAHNSNISTEIKCVCGHKCPTICGSKILSEYSDTRNKIIGNETDLKSNQAKSSKFKSQDDEIPERPHIILKDVTDQEKRTAILSKDTLETYDSHKVNFYDHPNRFSREKQVPPNAYVEKITSDSVEVIPNIISEKEFHQKMKQRDKEAYVRGQKALEKERIQKDYEEMLRKLPLLQKKERICELKKDKQEYHMSEDRLKERDKKKQNVLDNAYNKFFPNLKPAIVTLPSKNREQEFGQILPDEPIQSLNVGNWDVDHEEQKMFTAEEVQDIVKAFTEQNPKGRREKLKQLLKSLKLQKEQLINEIKSLPANNSINELINDLKSFSDSDDNKVSSRKKDKRTVRKRQRDEHEIDASTDSTTESSSSTAKPKHKMHYDAKAPSPRKKQKKSKRKVLILQNMSTQTTPKTSVISYEEKVGERSDKGDKEKVKPYDQVANRQKPVCPKLQIPCDCNKENQSSDEVCQIVIKLNDNDDPEVVVKSKEKQGAVPEGATKENSKHKKTELISVGVGTEEINDASKPEKTLDNIVSKEVQKKIEEKPKRVRIPKKIKSDLKTVDNKTTKPRNTETDESKAKSWREQLSKNSISTSSTSYFSPPDFQKTSSAEQSKQSLYNLRKKPQQSNLQDFSAALSISQSLSAEQKTGDLILYIEKLLRTSRGSIENLTVSTSSVQTPSQSVIEMDSNNPVSQLHNLIKNGTQKNIYDRLSCSPEYSSFNFNTSDSTPEVLHPKSTQGNITENGDHFSKSDQTNQSSRAVTDKETSSCSVRSKDSVLAQYADITDSCSKRIAELAAMIDQIREEKIQILQNPPSADSAKGTSMEKDNSTAYLELPASNDNSSKQSSLNSLDDEELQRRLLDIDFSLAEKLRKFTKAGDKRSDEDGGEKELSGSSKGSADETNSTNKELWSRLNQLVQQKESTTDPQNNNLEFVPFLSDIPKLPKLVVQPENLGTETMPLHRRPPPSKGLTVAKKFNGGITLVPHELSTIIETESQLSTKLGNIDNSRTSQAVSPQKDFELIVQPEVEVANETTSTSIPSSTSDRRSPNHVTKIALSPTTRCHYKCIGSCSKEGFSTSSSNSSEGTTTSIVLLSESKKALQTSSSDEGDALEAMLKSIGMEWAIPTLHKTQEALALTSSSSSLELGSRNQILSSNASASEISLKQYLQKQIKISSSTLKSDASPASFSGELSELSSIQANISNAEKSNQKTSTPVVSCRSTDNSVKRVVFSACSDISSVRDDRKGISQKSSKTSYRSLTDFSETKSGSDEM